MFWREVGCWLCRVVVIVDSLSPCKSRNTFHGNLLRQRAPFFCVVRCDNFDAREASL